MKTSIIITTVLMSTQLVNIKEVMPSNSLVGALIVKMEVSTGSVKTNGVKNGVIKDLLISKQEKLA